MKTFDISIVIDQKETRRQIFVTHTLQSCDSYLVFGEVIGGPVSAKFKYIFEPGRGRKIRLQYGQKKFLLNGDRYFAAPVYVAISSASDNALFEKRCPMSYILTEVDPGFSYKQTLRG